MSGIPNPSSPGARGDRCKASAFKRRHPLLINPKLGNQIKGWWTNLLPLHPSEA